jgi:hypothetical protein
MTWSAKILPFVNRGLALTRPAAGTAVERFPRLQKPGSRPGILPRSVRGFAVPPLVDR